MYFVVVVASLLGGDPADLPPPPPPLDPAAVAPAPLDPAAAAETAPRPRTPVMKAPPPAPPAPIVRPAAMRNEPMDPLIVAGLQAGTFCGAATLGLPCAAFLPGGGCLVVLVPAAAGYAATWFGDKFGASRAPAIWPVVASYAAMIFGSSALGFLYFGFGGVGNLGVAPGVLLGAGGLLGILAGASVVAIPASYALTAVPKRPGDDGSAQPSWFEPAAQRY